jgi:hypothetical protein
MSLGGLYSIVSPAEFVFTANGFIVRMLVTLLYKVIIFCQLLVATSR